MVKMVLGPLFRTVEHRKRCYLISEQLTEPADEPELQKYWKYLAQRSDGSHRHFQRLLDTTPKFCLLQK